jgi:uncharacterized protein (DUF1778 family)
VDNKNMKHRDRFTVRFSKEEIATIEKAAKYEKITPSDFIRKCVATNYLNHPDQNAIMEVQRKIALAMREVLREHLPAAMTARKKSA